MRMSWIALLVLLGAGTAVETVQVKREGARVMKAPRFFGEACPVTVSAGQRVQLTERQGGWARLAAPGGGNCWLHESAWSDRKSGELVGDPAVASQRDIELAGRGFSEEEEKNYRSANPDLKADYAIVDAYVERAPETPPRELSKFLADGTLGGKP
jgi:hypothetical protein